MNSKAARPARLSISDTENGLTFDEPDFKLRAMAKFDGKPGTVEGPTIPDGASFVLTKVSTHSFKMTRTQNGKAFDSSTWTVLTRWQGHDKCDPNHRNQRPCHQ